MLEGPPTLRLAPVEGHPLMVTAEISDQRTIIAEFDPQARLFQVELRHQAWIGDEVHSKRLGGKSTVDDLSMSYTARPRRRIDAERHISNGVAAGIADNDVDRFVDSNSNVMVVGPIFGGNLDQPCAGRVPGHPTCCRSGWRYSEG